MCQLVLQCQWVFVHHGLILAFKAGDAILGECIKLESVVEMTDCDPPLIVLSCHL